MNLSVCTITFRHQLISIGEIAKWAASNGFQGIELWGAHAANLEEQIDLGQDWLAGFGLNVSMLSDYLPLFESNDDLYFKVHRLSRLANHWGTKKIRTFAGSEPSEGMTTARKRQLFNRLQRVCDWLDSFGLNLVVETHPNTFADSVASTIEMFSQVNRMNLQLNFDVLHVWESGADPIQACETLSPFINHFHFKNISDRDHLSVFAPENVYAAAGTRKGMVPLFEGMVDYHGFASHLYSSPQLQHIDSSLEWFGNNCKNILSSDRYQLQKLSQSHQTELAV